ncbi:MAG: hypothetical protein AMJ93_02645, partial [Anaerolineae bacterium SM23_84]
GRFPEIHATAAVTDVVLQQGRVPFINGFPVGPIYDGTDDTYMNRWQPTTNYYNESRLVLGQSGAYRPLIRFDLGPALIPSNATVISAELGIYAYARNIFNAMTVSSYQVLRPWNDQQANWNIASFGNPWTFGGADHAGTDRAAIASMTRTVFVRNEHHYFDITPIAQEWVVNPASNEGIVLIGPDPAVIYYYYNSRFADIDPAVIYYYYNSRFADIDKRPRLVITWTIAPAPPTPTPTPTSSPTPGPSPTPTATASPTPGPGPELTLDNTSLCYTHTLGVWQPGTAGGYGGDYEYESVTSVVTASWRPCLADPMPQDSMYEVFAHWSVHSARPTAVPYEIHYDGGTATVYVDQTKDATGSTVPNFSPSGWHSLGVYPFRAGTYDTTGEYVELSSPPDSTDTCADAVRWHGLLDVPGPPYAVAISASPSELPSDGSSTSTVAVTVTDKYGNSVADGTMVGFTTTLGTFPYAYVEAEAPSVTKLGTWGTGPLPGSSGGQVIYSNNFGDEVSWTFWGKAVSLVYYTHSSLAGVADVTVDGNYVATINFGSAVPQFRVERQLANSLPAGPHTVRVRASGSGYVWLDAFRSGATTTGGVATAPLTAPSVPGTAVVRGTALGAGLTGASPAWPFGETTVSFPGPLEVWVDDDYCAVCANDGHHWGYTAFDNIQDGVDEVLGGGTVHVAAGVYPENVTINKPVSLLGAGRDVTILDGVSDAPGSRGFYVNRADNVTISGFRIKNFETGVYLRGTGVNPGPRVYNATVVYNAFESNDAGSSSHALYGNYVYTSTICSNDIALGYNGIYLQNTYGTVICYNDIHENKGFGVKIDTGNDNSIDNNDINNNQNVGVELTGPTERSGVYGNILHDLWWDGVLVNGATDPQIVANTIFNTNLAWLNAAGSAPDGSHNLGGVVLLGTTNSAVYDNRIYDVSDAEGNRANAAGIWLQGNSAPILIETNLIKGCTRHGIHVPTGPIATIHGNSIYSNGGFGLHNTTGHDHQVQGNWWGRNTPTTGATAPKDIRDRSQVSWWPPIRLSLTAVPDHIPADGMATSTITATASGYGYDILDGTWITFTNSGDFATLLNPLTGVFGAGQVNTMLRAGTIAGVETITGTAEPGIEGQIVTVTLGALSPYSISITAHPDTVEVGGGSQGQAIVTATVKDIHGNGVPLVPVAFSTNGLGAVSPAASTTVTGTGAAVTTFTSGGLLGTATVTATASVTLTASTNIAITAGPPCTGTITAVPAEIPANGVATSTITVALTDCWGYSVPDGTMVGFTTTNGSIVDYSFVGAESPTVVTSLGWSTQTSGGRTYIQTSSPGAAAFWTFRGQAISIVYRRYASGDHKMRVQVDGGPPVDIDATGAPLAWVEKIIATNLDPLAVHQLQVTHQSGTIALDAFRSGTVTAGGVAWAILRAPVSAVTETGTVYATTALDHPVVPQLVLTTTVVFGRTDVVWVDDDWTGLADGTAVSVPGGTAYIGNNAFDTIPEGVGAVQPAGTVYVLSGNYPLPVVITKTLNLLGAGSETTFITGSGSGNGIRVRPNADNATIEGFGIRNFGYGVYVDGFISNYIDGITLASNVISSCTTGAITATHVNNGYFANNALHSNDGFGLDLHRGSNNTIFNNEIYDLISGFGLRLRGTSGAMISYNNVHDVEWDGIQVGVNSASTSVVSNTVHTTNIASGPASFSNGGVVLNSSTNSTVEYNTIFDVLDAGGTTFNTAGVHIDGNDANAMIRYNKILANTNDGVLLSDFISGQPPEIHCNHIYGNGRFGLRNTRSTQVDATDNWWGRNTPTRAPGPPPPPIDIYWPDTNVAWNPRIRLTLTAAQPEVYAGGDAIAITALACGTSCCLLDGTLITFTTDLGYLGPSLQTTVLTTTIGGQAVVMFTPGTQTGVATITARIPNNGIATVTVTIKPGDPWTITVTADPTSIPVGNIIPSTITAHVRDMYNNDVEDGYVIQFDTDLGWTLAPTGTTVSGVATTTLHSGVTPGTATVSARYGMVVGYTTVEFTAGPPFTITSLVADPPSILANGLDTSAITATVKDQYGNLVTDGTMVGYTSTYGSLIFEFVEAESADVITSSAWTIDPTGTYIRTSVVGAEASWQFRGQAVSLIYRRYSTGGEMFVRVDGGPSLYINTAGTPAAWVERVIATNLDPEVMHEIKVTCASDQIRLNAFRSGAATSGGQASAVLTSDPLPPHTAVVWATAIGGTFPTRTVEVEFLGPLEVWVDDDYCVTCFNDGHMWGFEAFSDIPTGVWAVRPGGTVHVLSGTYTLPVTINKPLHLDGEGSGSTSAIVGSGTGTGIRVHRNADGSTIEGFQIRDWGYGVYLDGRSFNYLDGITFTDNVISGCVTGAITATYVNDGYFADIALHNNDGFGFDLDHGADNTFINSHIFSNAGFGLRMRSTADGYIAQNTIYNLGWDGIRLGGCSNTSVLSNTIHNTNLTHSPSGFNAGGIALNSTANTTVEYNTIYEVRDDGGIADTAGIWMGGSDSGTTIQYNRILSNTNNGLLLTSFASPPEIHCNHIYANERYGLRNTTGVAVHAEGNWWGHNPPLTSNAYPPSADIRPASKVLWDPPIVLSVTAAQPTAVAGGPPITVTVEACGGGCCLLDGTVVSFDATPTIAGSVSPPTAVMSGGQSTASFTPGTTAWITATVWARVANNGVATDTIYIVAAPPYTVSVTASPSSLWAKDCAPPGKPYTSTIEATVTDQYGNPNIGELVLFSRSPVLGTLLSPGSATAGVTGTAWSTLTAGDTAGTTEVRAEADSKFDTALVEIMPGPPMTSMFLDALPPIIAADGVSTAIISATVYDDCANFAYDGTMVGYTTTKGSLIHEYVEAESSAVTKSAGDWTTEGPNAASGDHDVSTSTPGAWARWDFRGSAVSVIYRRGPAGGTVRLLVDAGPARILSMNAASTEWRRETVAISELAPAALHTVQVECITGTCYLDAFRSGATTHNGVATAALTSAKEVATANVEATAIEYRTEHNINPPHRSVAVLFRQAELSISKVANPLNLLPAELVDFHIHYTNTSTMGQATDMLITDTLPSSLEFVASASSPDIGAPVNLIGNDWVWDAGNVQPGASGVITLTARRRCPSGLGTVTNWVRLSSLTLESDPNNNDDSALVTFIRGAPYYVTITGHPPVIETDASTVVRISVSDQCGVPIPFPTVHITTNLGAFNAAGTLTHTTQAADANGETWLTFWSRPPISGTATIQATAITPEGSATGVGYVFIGVGPAEQCLVTAFPPAIPADGVSTSAISARVLDTGGNFVPDGFFVGFTTSLGSLLYDYVQEFEVNQSPPASWTTHSDSQASGGGYVRTTVDGASIYWNMHGNGASIVYRQAPGAGIGDVYVDGHPLGSINMDGPETWRAERIYDWVGSPTAAHTLRLTHRAGTGPIYMDAFRSGVTTSGGQAVAMLTAAPVTGLATVAATAVSETVGIVPDLVPGFVDVRFDPADVTVSKAVQPTGQVAIGQQVTFTLTYENQGPITATAAYLDDTISNHTLGSGWLQDAFFSTPPVIVTPNLHFYWSLGSLAPGQSGTISFGGTVSESGYWPSLTVITNTVLIGSSTVDPQPGNNISTVSTAIVPGTVATLTLTATPGSIPVGGSTSTLRATVRDAHGNPAPNGTPVRFTTTMGGFPVAQEEMGYTTDGVATLSLTSGPTAGIATVTASLDSVTATRQVIFTPLNAVNVTVIPVPDRIKVGGSTSVIEARVTDQHGNPVANGTMVSFASSMGFINPPGATTVDGSAFSVLTSGSTAGTATVTATAGSVIGTNTVIFEAGEAGVSIDANPRSLRVGQVSVVTVRGKDQFGNPVPDGTVVTFDTSFGYFTDSLTDAIQVPTSGGSASTGLTSTRPGTAVVRGTIGTESASVLVTFDPDRPASIQILSVEPGLIPSCVGTAIASAEVKDRYGNPVLDGTVVVFDVIPTGDVEPIDGGRTLNGVAQAIISAGTTPTWATVIAWPQEYRTTVSDQYGIEFQVGPPDRLEVSAEPPSLFVGGNSATIRVRVLDCGDNPVTEGTLVTFTLASGQGSLAPPTATTVSGRAFSTLTSPNETGSAVIRVTAGDRERTIVVDYIPGPPSEVVLSADPLSIPANGVSRSTIRADVEDLHGNPVADRTVVVFSTEMGSFDTGMSYTTFTEDGSASAVLRSSGTPGIARVEAIAAGKRASPIWVDFFFAPPGSKVYLPIITKNARRF